jgi:hypothetical protein
MGEYEFEEEKRYEQQEGEDNNHNDSSPQPPAAADQDLTDSKPNVFSAPLSLCLGFSVHSAFFFNCILFTIRVSFCFQSKFNIRKLDICVL